MPLAVRIQSSRFSEYQISPLAISSEAGRGSEPQPLKVTLLELGKDNEHLPEHSTNTVKGTGDSKDQKRDLSQDQHVRNCWAQGWAASYATVRGSEPSWVILWEVGGGGNLHPLRGPWWVFWERRRWYIVDWGIKQCWSTLCFHPHSRHNIQSVFTHILMLK